MLLQERHRRLFLALLMTVLVAAAWSASQLRFSADFDEFVVADDRQLAFYEQAKQQFAPGDPQMVIGIATDGNIFNQTFLEQLLQFEQRLMTLEGVVFANSIASLRNPVRGTFRVKEEPFIHVNSPEKYLADTTLLFQYPDVHPKFVSPDRSAVCVFVRLKQVLPPDFPDQIKHLTESAGLGEAYYYGLSIAEDGYQSTLQKEVITLSLIALTAILLVLWFAFRAYQLLVISFLFLLVVNVLNLGVLQLMGASLNVLTVTVPAVVGIVSMSDVFHVYTRFREEDLHIPFADKISRTYRDLKQSLILTSVTTAVGFLSLIFTEITPFTHFGLATASGILIAYVLTIYLLPLLLKWGASSGRDLRWQMPERLYAKISRHAKPIMAIAVVLSAFSIYFGSQVQLNTYLYDDLDADDPLSQSLAFFEENFFGIRDLELFVTVKEGHTVYDRAVVDELVKLEAYLQKEYGARDLFSLATLIKRYNRAYYHGKPSQFIVPSNPVQYDRLIRFLQEEEQQSYMEGIVNQPQNLMRVYVKVTDEGSAVANEKNQHLKTFIANELDFDLIDIQLGGQPLFIDKGNELITRYLFKSLLGALLVVFVIVLLVYRSFRLAIIAFIPNVLPMLLMLGLMYWLDITLKKSTAVIFTIAFGIAVDDTIHFLSRFRYMLQQGMSASEALHNTWQTTGKAILITSLVLVAGFGSFAFSSFQSTFLTGTLVSAVLLTAVFADLVLLVVLIRKGYL